MEENINSPGSHIIGLSIEQADRHLGIRVVLQLP